jgi:hypothetical protein
MNLDQKIQVWNAVGTWLAGIATFAAVVVSLYLARRADRIRIQANVGIRLVFAGDGTPAEEHVGITATNHGDRPVIINSIGWRVGKGKTARHCIQPVAGEYTHQCPKQLTHGEQGYARLGQRLRRWFHQRLTAKISNVHEYAHLGFGTHRGQHARTQQACIGTIYALDDSLHSLANEYI